SRPSSRRCPCCCSGCSRGTRRRSASRRCRSCGRSRCSTTSSPSPWASSICATSSTSCTRRRSSCGRRCACWRRGSGGPGDDGGRAAGAHRPRRARAARHLRAGRAAPRPPPAAPRPHPRRTPHALRPDAARPRCPRRRRAGDRLSAQRGSPQPPHRGHAAAGERPHAARPRRGRRRNRSPALARQYGVASYGAIVVESGGRRRVFSNPSEEAFLGALLHVTRQQRKTVGWLVGNGEGDPTSTDRYRGYSTARRLLENEDYDVRAGSLIGDEVPPETTVLVIAGPKRDPLPEELAALDRYLQRPGQALVLLDAVRTPELAHFLHRYWVEVGDD